LPQVLIIAAAGAGLYAAYKVAKRLTSERARPKAEEVLREPRDLGALKRDPATGEYRPE
jgi:hypothetical protein